MRTRPLTTLQERDIVDVLAGFRLKKCQQDSGIKAGFPQASLRELNGGAPVDGDEAVGLPGLVTGAERPDVLEVDPVLGVTLVAVGAVLDVATVDVDLDAVTLRIAQIDSFADQMVGSAFLLSIPLVLFYGSIYVIVRAWREHRLTGEISPRLAGVVHWAPRIAAVVIILFAGLFSLDVFAMEGSPLELAVGFLIHNVPSILMIVMLVFAWRKPAVGFFAFLAAGVAFLYFVVFGGNLGNFLLFSGPLLLISALFYADWRWQRPQPGASPHPAV